MAKTGLKILVVDDNSDARIIVGRTLRSKGYEVVEAATGKEVLSRAKAEWPALIVLDVVLPDVPGTEVLQQLRADPITKIIPVLLVTAKPTIVSQLPFFQQGTDRFLDKTSRPEDLARAVHEMLIGTRGK